MSDAPPPITPPLEKGVGCLTAAVSLGAVVVGAVLAGAASPRGRGSFVFAVALLALTALGRRSPLDRAAFRLTLLPLALPLALVAIAEVGAPLVSRAPYEWDTTFVLAAYSWFIPPLTLVLAALGRAVARFVLAADRPRVTSALRVLAWTTALAGAAMVIAAMTRLGRTAPEAYVASLPIVARVAAVDESARSAEAVAGALRIRHEQDAQRGCRVFVERTDAAEPATKPHPLWVRPGACGPLVVRADAAHGLVVVEGKAGSFAYEAAAPQWPKSLGPSRVADAVRFPDASVALAALGVIAALVALIRRPRGPLPDDTSACRDAEASLDGTVRLDDGTDPLPLPPGVTPMLGAVVAVLAPRAESFRDHPNPVVLRVVPGSIAEHRLATRVGPASLALALVTLACTPLATAILLVR